MIALLNALPPLQALAVAGIGAPVCAISAAFLVYEASRFVTPRADGAAVMSSTVADTGEPLSIIIQAERDAARTFGVAAGLLIGGASQADAGIRSLDAGISPIEQAARDGASPEAVTAYAIRLQREAAALLARLVAIRVNATPTDSREAA